MRRLPFLALLLLSCQAGSSQQGTTQALDLEQPDLEQPEASLPDTAAQTILADDMRKHVELLASDEYGGRETLQPGYEMAAKYMAETFASYGLAPLPGQKNFEVEYKLWQHRYEPEGTLLSLSTKAGETMVALGTEGTPFGFSDEGELDADIVFAGYGITAPELGRDDYKGLNVKGKWVLVLRHAPGYLDEKSAFFGGERKEPVVVKPATPKTAGKPGAKGDAAKADIDPKEYSLFMTKAMNAQTHGAKGMLVVTGPLTAEMADDLRMPERLEVPKTAAEIAEREKQIAERKKAMEADAAEKAAAAKAPKTGTAKVAKPPTEKKLLAFHISPRHASALIANTNKSLVDLQEAVDAGAPAKSFKIKAHARGSVQERKEPATVIAKNVIGYLEGSDPTLKDEFVVIGGHFDHLGRMSADGDAADGNARDTVYNGADDNASGTSGVLELAQAFTSSSQRPRRSMLFMGFSGEEKGLLGARALVKQGDIDTSKIAYMINLDMIGRNSDKDIEFVGADYATGIREMLEAVNTDPKLDLGFVAQPQRATVMRALPAKPSAKPARARIVLGPYAANSDHEAFFQKEVPVAFFFTGTHEDYHKLSDHADKLDYPRMQSIVRLAYALARGVAEADERPVFIYKLDWLGASVQLVGDAARFTAVEADSRASRAGIMVGDTIHKIGESSLDLGKAANATSGESESAGRLLDQMEPGSKFPITIERDRVAMTLLLERAKRGYLGIFPGTISDDDRQKFSIDSSEGVLIGSTGPEAPAYKSGLREGDIITKLGGHSVNNATLMKNLSRIGAGETIVVQVIRGGQRIEMPLTLGEPR